jgi:hypothetical protein
LETLQVGGQFLRIESRKALLEHGTDSLSSRATVIRRARRLADNKGDLDKDQSRVHDS